MNDLLAEAKARLQALERQERRTPPGYPLGYKLHLINRVCVGCGHVGLESELWVCDRTGANNKGYHRMRAKETVYDLPVETVTINEAQPRCYRCIADLPREVVPALPPPKAILSVRWAKEEKKETEITKELLKELGLL